MTASGTACSPTASFLFFYFLSNWNGGRGRVIEILVYTAMSCTHVCVGQLTHTSFGRTPLPREELIVAQMPLQDTRHPHEMGDNPNPRS